MKVLDNLLINSTCTDKKIISEHQKSKAIKYSHESLNSWRDEQREKKRKENKKRKTEVSAHGLLVGDQDDGFRVLMSMAGLP